MHNTSAYRYPNERLVLALTLLLVGGVIAVTASATVCLSAIFLVVVLLISYAQNRIHHSSLLAGALPVTDEEAPELADIAGAAAARIQPGPIDVFLARSDVLNAYTFGLVRPKVIVLYDGLLRVMDAEELQFVIGHEMGHVRLDHTVLNSLVGGLAGIPSPFAAGALLAMAFLWWNRACEFSADRAGLLACGDVRKAVSALVKLAAGGQVWSEAEYSAAMQRIDAEDDHALAGLEEALSSHPMTIRRIQELHAYAQSGAYKRLQSLVNRNDSVSSRATEAVLGRR
jgi:Zn-dependent protease with chaperone function